MLFGLDSVRKLPLYRSCWIGRIELGVVGFFRNIPLLVGFLLSRISANSMNDLCLEDSEYSKDIKTKSMDVLGEITGSIKPRKSKIYPVNGWLEDDSFLVWKKYDNLFCEMFPNSFNPYETWCRKINSKVKGICRFVYIYISYPRHGIPRQKTPPFLVRKTYSDSRHVASVGQAVDSL